MKDYAELAERHNNFFGNKKLQLKVAGNKIKLGKEGQREAELKKTSEFFTEIVAYKKKLRKKSKMTAMFLKMENEFDLLDFSPKYIRFVKSPEYTTYLLLRRRIRRRSFNKKVTEYLKKDYLVASVSLNELALLQEVSVSRVSQYISELRNKWNVLKTGKRTGRELIYVLGKYSYEDGKRTEILYDDTFAREVEERKREKELMGQSEGRKISLEEFLANIVKPNSTQSLAELNTEFSSPKLRTRDNPAPKSVCGEGIDNRIDKRRDKKDLPEKISGVPLEEKEIKEGLKERNFFGQGISAEETVARHFSQGYSHFKKRRSFQYNCNDLLILFCIEYYEKHKRMYSPSGKGNTIFGGKDSRNLKTLLRSQSPETLAKVIPYFIKNYEEIPGVPKDKPCISILYGWRNTIIPRCLLGTPALNSIERGRRGEITDEEWEREIEEER